MNNNTRLTTHTFMKIYNTGEKVLVHKHEGHIQSRIVYYLMNIHIVPRTIYLTRHGESVMNLESKNRWRFSVKRKRLGICQSIV